MVMLCLHRWPTYGTVSRGKKEAGRYETTCPRASAAQMPHTSIPVWDSRSCPELQILHSCYCCVFNKGHCKATMWWRANHTKKPDRFCFCHLHKGISGSRWCSHAWMMFYCGTALHISLGECSVFSPLYLAEVYSPFLWLMHSANFVKTQLTLHTSSFL